MQRSLTTGLAAAALALPLGAWGAGEWSFVTGELTPEQAAQRARAEQARDAAFNRLMARLKNAVEAEGPARAIGICRLEAPRIGRGVATEHGVRMGRTSFRLRNPKNRPPEWAEALVEERVADPVFLTHPDGRLAAFLPIRLKREC